MVLSNVSSEIQMAQLLKIVAKFGSIEHISVDWAVQEQEGTLGQVKVQFSTLLEADRAKRETEGAVLNKHVLGACLLKHQ